MALRLPDIAQGVVLPEYTDEHLRAEMASDDPSFRRRAELLLSVPAAQRQNIEAEATRRSSRRVTHWSNGRAESVRMLTGSHDQAREAIVAAYLRSTQED